MFVQITKPDYWYKRNSIGKILEVEKRKEMVEAYFLIHSDLNDDVLSTIFNEKVKSLKSTHYHFIGCWIDLRDAIPIKQDNEFYSVFLKEESW